MPYVMKTSPAFPLNGQWIVTTENAITILMTSIEWICVRPDFKAGSSLPLSDLFLPLISEITYLSNPLRTVARATARRMVRTMYMLLLVTFIIVPSLRPVRNRLWMR